MASRDQALVQQLKLASKSNDIKVFIPDKSKSYLWHVSYKGPADSPFAGGIYHAVVDLSQYPQSAPSVCVITPSGGYQVGVHLCLVGITHYHQEGWSQGTSIEGIMSAISAYMLPESRLSDGIGMIRSPADECKKLAKESLHYTCKDCGCDHSKLFQQKKEEEKKEEKKEEDVVKKVVQKKKMAVDLDDE